MGKHDSICSKCHRNHLSVQKHSCNDDILRQRTETAGPIGRSLCKVLIPATDPLCLQLIPGLQRPASTAVPSGIRSTHDRSSICPSQAHFSHVTLITAV